MVETAAQSERGAAEPRVVAVDRGPTAARWVFVAALVAAVPVIAVAGRAQWFHQDEWMYLADRDGGSVRHLFRPLNEHWSTIPVAAYRLLWNAFGLRAYEPYQAMIIALHLVIVVLLRMVMRRAGVHPWIATAAAVVLLFYGTGHENIVWGVQVGFASSLAFGLAALLLADTEAPSPRRRAAVFGCAVGSLMGSGIGLVMVGVLGLALLLRRGWRAAAAACVPVAVVYGLWWFAYGRNGPSRERPPAGDVVAFVDTGLRAALLGQGRIEAVAALLVFVTLAGLAVTVIATWRARPDDGGVDDLRRRLGLPVALAAGAVAFLLVTGVSRAATGVHFASRSRYVYVVMALLLPVMAAAFDALVRRWPRALVPALVLLVVGIPGNVASIEVMRKHETRKDVILAVAHSDLIATVDPTTVVFPEAVGTKRLTAGWLHDGAESGRIPEPGEVSAEVEAEVAALLALRVVEVQGQPGECRPLREEEVVELDEGESVGFVGALWVRVEGPDGALLPERPIGSFEPRALTTAGPPLTLHIRPRQLASLCG